MTMLSSENREHRKGVASVLATAYVALRLPLAIDDPCIIGRSLSSDLRDMTILTFSAAIRVPKPTTLLSIIGSVLLAACSNGLPQRETPTEVVWLEQNWSDEQRSWFHHADQGTQSFLIPLEWFSALEQPGLHLFGDKPLLIEPDYMAQIGFIPADRSAANPAGLPVGFAVGTPDADGNTPVGFTCAACHTGQMTYQGVSIRYDGGPAMIAADVFMGVLLRSMMETAFNTRQFHRFAQRVLGDDPEPEAKEELGRAFRATVLRLITFTFRSIEEVEERELLASIEAGEGHNRLKSLAEAVEATLGQTEGYARTDALTRIGNQVFALDVNRPENFAPVSAPVSFPPIWNTSWFNWVQYDGSIMQPMMRNAGESLGVGALITLDASSADNLSSSVRIDNLYEIEHTLAGATPPFETQSFNGLRSPRWPEDILGEIDQAKAALGADLYQQYCQSCHLPAPDTDAFWSEEHWSVTNGAGVRLLDVPLIPVSQIGTDPEQSKVLATRFVNTEGMGINTTISVGADCETLQVTDGPRESFAFSLGAVVEEIILDWYEKNEVPASDRERLNGYMPNCLQASESYKARPLNGIWATAPFLHNGSVPSLYALLSPVEERPTRFHVGGLEFDPVQVGYETHEQRGLFLFDASRSGNSNAGHEFRDGSGPGVIGPLLAPELRWALVEYLKTL